MKERLSALMDDALEESSVASVLDSVRNDQEALRTWDVYHLIGDSLRGEAGPDGNLAARVISGLESEPSVLAPMPSRSQSSVRMRWLLPLAASVMGVGAVAWVAQTLNGPAAPAAVAQSVQPVVPVSTNVAATGTPLTTASKESVTPVAGTPAVAPVRMQFEREYLIAHQAYSPGANLSGVAQYVRTVSETRDEFAR